MTLRDACLARVAAVLRWVVPVAAMRGRAIAMAISIHIILG